MTRLLITTWDGIHFAPVNAVEKAFFGLGKEDNYSC